MKLKSAIHCDGYTEVYELRLGCIYQTEQWPLGFKIDDFLRALCGTPDSSGWYVYHEDDCQWLIRNLELASQLTRLTVGTLAMTDPVNLRNTPSALSQLAFGCSEPTVSHMAATALATKVLAKAWNATDHDVADIVRMNMFAERAMV